MSKKPIHAVISEVLASSDRPMSAREIYELIVSQNLYEFKAKDPANIVRGQLRRHSLDPFRSRMLSFTIRFDSAGKLWSTRPSLFPCTFAAGRVSAHRHTTRRSVPK